MHIINLNINNIQLKVDKNQTIIQACLSSNKLNIDLPRFCFHEKLSIAGNCRMCLVEVLKSPKPVVSCAMQVMDGMVIKTSSNLVKKAREGVLEFLLANHPLDCPICDQAGECDLQDQSMIFGGDMGRFYEYKRSVEDKNCGNLVKTVMTRCIHCTRCVRFLNEIAGIRTLGVVGRGNKMEIGTYLEKILNSELSGNIIDICPVGALTSKPYAFTARSWELISKESIDIIDSLSADTKVDIRGTQIMRILPRLNEIINENWLSDNSRFYYDSILKNRILDPYKCVNNLNYKSNWEYVLKYLWNFFYINKYILEKTINFSYNSGELSDVQSLIMLKEFNSLFKKNSIKLNLKNNDFRQNYLLKFRKVNLLTTSLLLLIGLNLRIVSPLYNIRLKKLYLKKKLLIIYFGSTANLTYKFQHLGLGTKSLLKFNEGNNYFCNLFLRSINPICLISSNILKNNKSIINFLINIKKNYKNDFLYGVVNKYIGYITANEVNSSVIDSKNFLINNLYKNYYNKNSEFIYLLNSYMKFQNNKNFTIFQGSHFDFLNKNINILLPGLISLEKSSNYLNLEGINRPTKAILPLERNIRIDWKIIFAIILNYNNMLLKFKLNNLNKSYNLMLLNLNYNNIINIILNLLLLNIFLYVFILPLKTNIKINKIFYNFLILYFNDLNFNISNLSHISPIFNLKLYHNIQNFNILYLPKSNKLYNLNLNTYNDNFLKHNLLTRLSTTLVVTHNQLKKLNTNYIK